ncbi:organic cation/carnitine transporter 2-like [Boleophthalmus pectinirostris]|uniref:organic cation/carnitine transporter 2-like n=1 Tax=Boleophthalmus pectinirostris TaxID=150288 RepID=UPI00242BC46B|nr:organic cation/carnitine transporter 2-like [Boleophthalmus pectinirostris]
MSATFHQTPILARNGLMSSLLHRAVPESPRWLLSLGRTREAERILQMAALETHVEAPASILPPEELGSLSSEPCTFLDLLKTRNIRHITVMLWISWFSIEVINNGLSFSVTGLSGSPFVIYFCIAVIELPSHLFSWLALANFRRRMIFIIFGALGTIGLLPIFFTTDIYPIATLCFVLLCKFGALAVIHCMHIHTGELFPTIIRNTAMSSCAMFGRVGASLSPYLQLLAVVAPSLPWLLLALLTLLSVLLLSFLPETFQEPLPDAIEQMATPRRLMFRCSSTTVTTVSPVQEVLCTTHL